METSSNTNRDLMTTQYDLPTIALDKFEDGLGSDERTLQMWNMSAFWYLMQDRIWKISMKSLQTQQCNL